MNADPAADGRRRPGAHVRAAPRRRPTPCSSRSWSTSAGSPGSPARPASALVRPDRIVLVTDGRYETQAAEQMAAAGVADAGRDRHRPHRAPSRPSILRGRHRATSARWPSRPTPSRGASSGASPASCSPELVPSDALIDRLRVVKDDGEIARIEAAAAIATEALGNVGARPVGRPHGGRVRPRARHRDAAARRQRAELRDDRRLGPERRQAPPPARRAAVVEAATWSCSTSGPRSTATART